MSIDHARLHVNSQVPFSAVAAAIFQASRSTIANADGVHERAKYLVSVGCGSATIEEYTEHVFDITPRITLIDPDPDSFSLDRRMSAEPFHVHFATVHDFLVAHPDAYKNCVLILIWPSPDCATYDIEAVFALWPINIVFLGADPDEQDYESGAAGSLLLYTFLAMQKRQDGCSHYRLLHRRAYVTLDRDGGFCEGELLLRRLSGLDRTCACLEWYGLKGTKRVTGSHW